MAIRSNTERSSSSRRRTTPSRRTMPPAIRRRYEIVVAMADALEDILRWERRRVA